ncbi:MAG: helix-turn-helix domain-containing protein [Hymenobacter sp.]
MSFVAAPGAVAAGQCVAQLSARENDLLLLLAQHRNGVLDRRACLRQLWGDDDFFAGRSMDVYISRLRKRLASTLTWRFLIFGAWDIS